MAKNHRVWMIGALLVCFVSVQGNATLFASGDERSPAPAEHFRFTLDPAFLAANPSLGLPQGETAFSGQVRQGRPYSRYGRSRSVAALTIGTIAAIAGTAVLVYANRPECSANQSAGGCGYGTKVIGGAVLTGGIAGLVIGALTWR